MLYHGNIASDLGDLIVDTPYAVAFFSNPRSGSEAEGLMMECGRRDFEPVECRIACPCADAAKKRHVSFKGRICRGNDIQGDEVGVDLKLLDKMAGCPWKKLGETWWTNMNHVSSPNKHG